MGGGENAARGAEREQRRAVPGALHAGTLDVALTFVYDYVPAEPDPALDSESLLEESLYLATATGRPGHPGIQDLAAAPWIAGRKGTAGHPAIAAFAAAIREQSRLLGAVEGMTSVA